MSGKAQIYGRLKTVVFHWTFAFYPVTISVSKIWGLIRHETQNDKGNPGRVFSGTGREQKRRQDFGPGDRGQGFQEHQYKALLEKMFAEADPDWDIKPDIKWNFTKFVIDREGNVVARFEPTADMVEVEACVKALL